MNQNIEEIKFILLIVCLLVPSAATLLGVSKRIFQETGNTFQSW